MTETHICEYALTRYRKVFKMCSTNSENIQHDHYKSRFCVRQNIKPVIALSSWTCSNIGKWARAVVYRLEPFTIILLDRTYDTCEMQPISLKFDPGILISWYCACGFI